MLNIHFYSAEKVYTSADIAPDDPWLADMTAEQIAADLNAFNKELELMHVEAFVARMALIRTIYLEAPWLEETFHDWPDYDLKTFIDQLL